MAEYSRYIRVFHAEVVAAMKANGVYYVSDTVEADAFRRAIFVDGNINGEVVGQSTDFIAKKAGVDVPANTTVIAVESNGSMDDVLRKEKMCPVLVIFTYNDFAEAIQIAEANLEIEGKGHSCAIHSNNDKHIEAAGLGLDVSRLVVNQPSSTSAGGSFVNGFAPSTTLGCGSWGNNSISENLDYKHLINIERIGYPIDHAVIPSDEQIWAE